MSDPTLGDMADAIVRLEAKLAEARAEIEAAYEKNGASLRAWIREKEKAEQYKRLCEGLKTALGHFAYAHDWAIAAPNRACGTGCALHGRDHDSDCPMKIAKEALAAYEHDVQAKDIFDEAISLTMESVKEQLKVNDEEAVK